jgi:hypothetical protein
MNTDQMEEQFGVRILIRSSVTNASCTYILNNVWHSLLLSSVLHLGKKEGILPIQYFTNIQVPKSTQGNRSIKGEYWTRYLILDHILRLLY